MSKYLVPKREVIPYYKVPEDTEYSSIPTWIRNYMISGVIVYYLNHIQLGRCFFIYQRGGDLRALPGDYILNLYGRLIVYSAEEIEKDYLLMD